MMGKKEPFVEVALTANKVDPENVTDAAKLITKLLDDTFYIPNTHTQWFESKWFERVHGALIYNQQITLRLPQPTYLTLLALLRTQEFAGVKLIYGMYYRTKRDSYRDWASR